MADFKYVLPRLARHFLPDEIVSFLLDYRLIIKPGLETSSPEQAVQRYMHVLNQQAIPFVQKQVMVFGYGGNLAIACLLLQAGAQKVILCEREGFREVLIPASLAARFPEYFRSEGGKYFPIPEKISVHHQDISTLANSQGINKVDLILSSSVFEHLTQPKQIATVLSQLTAPDGAQLHFIDLRDHFFKYPFEMLCYEEKTWEKWLNPTSNLNRLRMGDYRHLFEALFTLVTIDIREKDEVAFASVKARILPHFKTGNENFDCATQISLIAKIPK